MTEIAAETGRDTAGSDAPGSGTDAKASVGQKAESVGEQAKEKVREGADAVQEKAADVKVQAGQRLRHELDTRSTQVGAELQSTAVAMRRAGEQLQQEGNDGPARVTRYVAERTERLGGYLSGSNSDRFLQDVEDFARRQPWLVGVGGATAGFLAARFLKASSARRYQSTDWGAGPGWQPQSVAWPESTDRERREAALVGTSGGSGGRPEH
jgi:hypothetical protein